MKSNESNKLNSGNNSKRKAIIVCPMKMSNVPRSIRIYQWPCLSSVNIRLFLHTGL